MENNSKEKMIEMAEKAMQHFNMYQPLITLMKRGHMNFSVGPAGASYSCDSIPELVDGIKKIRDDGNFPFYAVYHRIDDMECYKILLISKYAEENDYFDEDLNRDCVFSYVVNVTEPDFSEYGTCQFRPTIAGGLQRVA